MFSDMYKTAFDEGNLLCSTCGEFEHFNRMRLRSKREGTWRCNGCHSTVTTLYRHLGMFPPPEFKGIPTDVSEEFFRSAKQLDNQAIREKCQSMLEKFETHEQHYCNEGKFLPLGAWAHKGFDAPNILAMCHGTSDHKVHPVVGDTYRVRVFSTAESGSRGTKRSENLIADRRATKKSNALVVARPGCTAMEIAESEIEDEGLGHPELQDEKKKEEKKEEEKKKEEKKEETEEENSDDDSDDTSGSDSDSDSGSDSDSESDSGKKGKKKKKKKDSKKGKKDKKGNKMSRKEKKRQRKKEKEARRKEAKKQKEKEEKEFEKKIQAEAKEDKKKADLEAKVQSQKTAQATQVIGLSEAVLCKLEEPSYPFFSFPAADRFVLLHVRS